MACGGRVNGEPNGREGAIGRARIDALRAAMDTHGLDLCVAYGSGRHFFLGANPCWYLSGVRQLGRDAALLVPAQADPVLLVTPAWDAARARRAGWVRRVVGAEALLPALGRELAGLGLPAGYRAGLVGLGRASERIAAGVAELLTAGATDADELFLGAARPGDELMIVHLERAVAIADEGYRHLLAVARPGMREFELAAECDWAMRSRGADDNFQLISASQHGHAVHPPGDRELRAGDVLLAEISPSVAGHFAQICRTAVLGQPDQAHHATYAAQIEAFEAGLRAANPGATVGEVAAAINAVMTDRGYGAFTKPPYLRTRGHAMGLSPLIPPDVTEASEIVLQPGMSFVLHPNQYFPERGYLLCGEQIVIEENGARVVSPRPLGLDTIEVDQT